MYFEAVQGISLMLFCIIFVMSPIIMFSNFVLANGLTGFVKIVMLLIGVIGSIGAGIFLKILFQERGVDKKEDE